MNIEVQDLQTGETDDRGRFSLGAEFANKRVMVAVVKVEGDHPEGEELGTAYRDIAENAEQFADEWDETSTEAWSGLER